jgi:hypothetical protein
MRTGGSITRVVTAGLLTVGLALLVLASGTHSHAAQSGGQDAAAAGLLCPACALTHTPAEPGVVCVGAAIVPKPTATVHSEPLERFEDRSERPSTPRAPPTPA